MCGRFAAGPRTWAELYELHRGFLDSLGELSEDATSLRESYNIKPTQDVGMLHPASDGLHLIQARWWFVPHWFKDAAPEWKATTFNAKIETANEKPTFRDAWRHARCLIPANGYYEWTGPKGQKQPWYITPKMNEPGFFFAGLWSRLRDGTSTCAILTRPAAQEIEELHPRMPVILKGEELAGWLSYAHTDTDTIAELGTGWQFQAHKVRRFGMKEDGPDLIAPWDG